MPPSHLAPLYLILSGQQVGEILSYIGVVVSDQNAGANCLLLLRRLDWRQVMIARQFQGTIVFTLLIRKPTHQCERRAELMADIGEEQGLGTIDLS
jgi:hypothetical protein